VRTLNEKLIEGTPFEMKPLRTIKISDVEVSEKMPTLAIEEESKIPPLIRKATVEKVLDEEVSTLAADQLPTSEKIIEEIPPLSRGSEDSDEELLKVATLEFDEVELEEDEMIITYIQEEPIIGIFDRKDTPFTKEHDYPKYDYIKNSSGI
jgi:hypothetical protein